VSKAFTRESDEDVPEDIASVRPQLPPGARNYITREGADRLRNHLDELLEKRKLQSTDRVRLEPAIRKLQNTLASVVVTEPPVDQGKIAFGASVLVRYQNDEQEQYRIVGVDEAAPEHNRISWISPLARALLNRREGDTVAFLSPAGKQMLQIIKVDYGSEK
jgi:transcription elongation factor GreB